MNVNWYLLLEKYIKDLYQYFENAEAYVTVQSSTDSSRKETHIHNGQSVTARDYMLGLVKTTVWKIFHCTKYEFVNVFFAVSTYVDDEHQNVYVEFCFFMCNPMRIKDTTQKSFEFKVIQSRNMELKNGKNYDGTSVLVKASAKKWRYQKL